MKVGLPTHHSWVTHDAGLWARLHAFARAIIPVSDRVLAFGPPPAPTPAPRSSLADHAREGVSPVFLSANPATPRLDTGVPAPAAPRAAAETRAPVVSIRERRRRRNERRTDDRRVRNDGSPYGVERRSNRDDRGGDRRDGAPADIGPAGAALGHGLPAPRPTPSGVRQAQAVAQDLLVRFHGR